MTRTVTAGGPQGRGVWDRAYDKFGFGALFRWHQREEIRRSFVCITKQPFEIGEIGTRIVPTSAVCNLLRSLCDRYAQTLKSECGTLWTSRIWMMDGWECAVEMCQARNGKKRERERNGKGTRSFLSRSSIFGHPFFSRFWPKS